MNIFVLDTDPKLCAEYHCDKHVVKMILEHAQLLSTALRAYGVDAGYKATHVNHPSSKWVRQSQDNFNWLVEMTFWLNLEYTRRYRKPNNHKSWELILSLPSPSVLPNTGGVTDFAIAMAPEFYHKSGDPVLSYRNYYKQAKKDFARWTAPAKTPTWWYE